MAQFLILDRDGVINAVREGGVTSPGEWEPLPGSLEAIARATRAGYRVVVVSNEPGISRGELTIDTLNAIHQKMLKGVQELGGEIDAMFFCPHDPEEGCSCRLPQPGLFEELSYRLRRPLEGIPVIADDLTELEAARRVRAKPILVRTGHGQDTVEAGVGLELVPIFDDLAAVVDDLLDEA